MSSTRNTTNPGDRSAAEIEREVEQTRARLTGTVEELKDRVSPSTLAEQAMDWLRGSGGRQFLDNLGGTLRDNPVPVVLIAAGIGWLALSGREGAPRAGRWYDDEDAYYPEASSYGATGAYPGESYPPETYAGQPGSGAAEGSSLGERAGEAAEGMRQRAAHLGQGVAGTAAELRDRAGHMAGRVGEAAGETWHGATGAARAAAASAGQAGRQVARRAGRAWHAASDTASGLGRGAYRAGEDAGRRVSAAVEDQPLLLGALGLALGATLGALMPPTEAEDRLMGETRDRMADRLSGLAGEAYERAKETAEEHAQRAGEELGDVYERARERIAPAGAAVREGAQALGDVARDLRETVERTAHDVAGAAREGSGTPTPASPPGTGAGSSPGTASGMGTGATPGTATPGTTTPGSTGVTPGASPGSVGGSRPASPRIGPV